MDVASLTQQSQPLIELWKALVGGVDFVPSQRQFLIWLSMYDVATVEKGISRTAVWSERNERKTLLDHIRYASGVMSTTKRDAAVSRG
jgi:hypothetical protein